MIWDWQVWGPTLGEIAAWLLFVLVPLGAMCWLLHQPEPRDELAQRRRLARIREMAEEQEHSLGTPDIPRSAPALHRDSLVLDRVFPRSFEVLPLTPHRGDPSDYKHETSESYGEA